MSTRPSFAQVLSPAADRPSVAWLIVCSGPPQKNARVDRSERATAAMGEAILRTLRTIGIFFADRAALATLQPCRGPHRVTRRNGASVALRQCRCAPPSSQSRHQVAFHADQRYLVCLVSDSSSTSPHSPNAGARAKGRLMSAQPGNFKTASKPGAPFRILSVNVSEDYPRHLQTLWELAGHSRGVSGRVDAADFQQVQHRTHPLAVLKLGTWNGSVCSKLLKLKAYSWSKLLTSELLFAVSHAERHLGGRNGLQDHHCN